MRKYVDVGYSTVGLLLILNCEVQKKLVECRDAISLLRRTQVNIFNESLELVEDEKSIPSDNLPELLSIDIFAFASMNDNTDVVQKENFSRH